MTMPYNSFDDPLAKALARVAELEVALHASEQIAKSASQELQYFVYAASHDLQEPLRAITSYSQLLERMYSADPSAKELTSFITSGVSSMNALIHNLLAYSRINQSPVLNPVPLSAAVQAVLFKLAPVMKQSETVVRFSSLPEIPAHELQVCQLFEHVFSNAILYRSPQPPQIEISSDEGELDGDPAQIIKIKDNGVGIEQQYLLQVVQPFKRLHGKDYPGNGLGLAICDKIMRAHKGRLWIESDGQSWTTVHLAFPL